MQGSLTRNICEEAWKDDFLVLFIKTIEQCLKQIQKEDEKFFDDIKKEIEDLSNDINKKLDEIQKTGVKITVDRYSCLFSMGLSSNVLEDELAPICNKYIFNDYTFTTEDIAFTENYLNENRNTNIENRKLSPAERKYNDWNNWLQDVQYERDNLIRQIHYLRYQSALLTGLDNDNKIKKYYERIQQIDKKIKMGKELENNKDRFNSFSYQQLEKIFEYYMFVKNNWYKYISIRKTLKKLEEEYIKKIHSQYSRALNLMYDMFPDYIPLFQDVTEKFYKIYHTLALSDSKQFDKLSHLYGNIQFPFNPSITMWLNELIGSNLVTEVNADFENNLVTEEENRERFELSFDEMRDLYIEISKDKQLYSFFRLLSIYYKKLEQEELVLPKDIDEEINNIYYELTKKEKLLSLENINVNYNSGICPIYYSTEIKDDRLKPLYNILKFNGLLLKQKDFRYIKNRLKSDNDETKMWTLTTSFKDEEVRVWEETSPIPLLLEEEKLEKKLSRLEKKSNQKIMPKIRKKHIESKKQKFLSKKEEVDEKLSAIRKCNDDTKTFDSFSLKQLELILDYYETVEKYQMELHSPDSSNTLEARWNQYIESFTKLTETRWERALERMKYEVEFVDDKLIEKMKLRILKICYMQAMHYIEKDNESKFIELNPESISWFNTYIKENMGLKNKKGK